MESKLQNYRVKYLYSLNETIDYWHKFKEVNLQYPMIRKITEKAGDLGIPYIWFFYEPFIEITWLTAFSAQSDKLFEYIEELCRSAHITDLEKFGPEDGDYADWFCESAEEREFGAKRHDICRQWVDLYWDYKDAVDKGKGLEEQVKRTIHTLCNPLALNFVDEGKLSASRALACLLFRYVKPRWLALFIYTKVFRQKY